MDYISAAAAAKKFGISIRRVQIYCEQGRISGVKRISGVWLIPDNSVKPEDARSSSQNTLRNTEMLTLNEAAEMLGVSSATARNWLKLGKLKYSENSSHFSREHIVKVLESIANGENSMLKSRRNKKHITGNILYEKYITSEINKKVIEDIVKEGKSLENCELRIILADITVKLFLKRFGKEANPKAALSDFITGKISFNEADKLICDILGNENILTDLAGLPSLSREFDFIAGEDMLGFAYISLRDLGERKLSGAYYTPRKSIMKLVENLKKCTAIDRKTVLDPCCGTGNFLIELSDFVKTPSQLYGWDIDLLSVQIARINMKLTFPDVNLKTLYSNFVCRNSLLEQSDTKFDIVLGNPPWGYDFSKEENRYLCQMFCSAQIKRTESYAVFIEKALEMLKENGFLAFVLPEAIMNVAIHEKIRAIIAEKCSISFVEYLGNVFSGVQCPSIILGLRCDGKGTTDKCRISLPKRNFIIHSNRICGGCDFILNISDLEYDCLNCIKRLDNAAYLKENADFALGIVTGNNKMLLKSSWGEGYEPVIKGSDIFRYGIENTSCYLRFEPERFQQCAPEAIYRVEEKLLYRFICEAPVFSYDNSQTLSLNSCNILIPRIENLKIKYVMAILNSSVAEFYIRNRFNSLKLLRSHLEQLPIPVVTQDAQDEIIELVNKMLGMRNTDEIYKRLDEKIMGLYGLEGNKRTIIEHSLQGKKKYLL